METTLYVIRHGQREDSEAGGRRRPAARPCDPDITETGQQQARETGASLAEEGITVVYASPFLRTVRTGALVAIGCKAKLRLEWGLAEWFQSAWWTEWPGTIPQEILARMFNIEPSEPTGIYPKLHEDDFWDAHKRYLATAVALADRHAGQKIALVTHGGGVLCIPAGLVSWNLPGGGLHRQCGITEMIRREGTWHAQRLNDVSHLTHVET